MKNRPTRSLFQSRLDAMVSAIRNEVTTGTMLTGDYLPSESELAKQYGMSKNSVRKGLEKLAEEGVIEKIPRVGNRISAAASPEETIITFVCHHSLQREACIGQLIDTFHNRYPHIRIRMIPLPEDHYIDTLQAYMENDLADLISINYDQYQALLDGGKHMLLEELPQDGNLYPFLQAGFTKDGMMHAKPFIFSPVILCYNREHFQKHELPEPDGGWTWHTLLNTAEQLAIKQKRYGFYFHLLSQNRWPVFLLQNGVVYDREKGLVDEERFLESMKLCRDLIINQDIMPVFLSEKERDAESLFAKGNVSIMMTTYFSLNHLIGCGIPFDVAPLPFIKEPRTLLLNIGVGILKQSSRKAAAKMFLDYITSYESQLLIRKQTYSIPSHKRAAEWIGHEKFYRPSRFHMYREMLYTFRYYTELGMKTEELDRLRSELHMFWSGMMSEQQLLKQVKQIFPEP